MRLPSLIDVHVHARVPGGTHKEDWDTCTAAALAGGISQVLAMPNTRPPVIDGAALERAHALGNARARCDHGHYLGATADNAAAAAAAAPRAVGLKLYLCHTHGPLLLSERSGWLAHFEQWPEDRPIAVHAEADTLAAVLELARRTERHIHVCHLPSWADLRQIIDARERGQRVTCEVAPHHLLLSTDDFERLGPGRCEVRPRLRPPEDPAELWAHLDAIDCIATAHAPHLLSEKDGPTPPPGFPTLEQSLGLMLTSVHDGRLDLARLVEMMATTPRRLFGIAEPPRSWVEVDLDAEWVVPERPRFSRAGWTPFAGHRLRGRIERVIFRGAVAVEGGRVLAAPGTGQVILPTLPTLPSPGASP